MDLLIFAGFKTLHCCLWTVNCCLFCQHWYRDLSLVLVANKLVKLVKTASSHEPSWMGWPGYRDQWIRSISPWVHMRTFSPVSEMRKGEVLGTSSGYRIDHWTHSLLRRIHPAFIYPGNRAEVFIWQNVWAPLPRSRLKKLKSGEPSQPAPLNRPLVKRP